MEGANRLQQTGIYIRKCFRIFANEKGWKTFISAAIITILICMVLSEDTFTAYKDTINGSFALVCACIWIGIFNSIQSVCKERDILKREHHSGLHMSSYVAAHMVYELVLSLAESLIVTVIITVANMSRLPSMGVFLPTALELLITFFLTIYSADALGLMVSSVVKNPNTAMTVMPFVLIIQLVMSGVIFELEGLTELISHLTIAKWAQRAICTSVNVNGMFLSDYRAEDDYKFTVGHLTGLWFLLIVFTGLYAIVATIALEFVDKDKR